jgi:hypothetical protein
VAASVISLAGVVGVAVMGYFFSKYLKAIEGGQAEKIKRLESELATERDRANADLRVEAFMRETRFANMAGRQVDALGELYGLLWEVQMKAADLVALARGDSSDPSSREKALHQAHADLGSFLRRSGYFLDDEL